MTYLWNLGVKMLWCYMSKFANVLNTLERKLQTAAPEATLASVVCLLRGKKK